jgi:uncharacterized protein YgiM (DUF1202 family)
MLNYLFFLLLFFSIAEAESLSTEQLDFPQRFSKTESLRNLLGEDWQIEREIFGDLNQDARDDLILLIRQNNPDAIESNEFGTVNHNPRLLVIAFQKENTWETISYSRMVSTAESPFQDEPLQEIAIRNGKLSIHLLFWTSAGSWTTSESKFLFRWQNDCLRLIGFDDVNLHRGNMEVTERSINFLTGKMRLRSGQNNKKLKEQWQNLSLPLICIENIEDGLAFDPQALSTRSIPRLYRVAENLGFQITSASEVRLRATASSSGNILATLPLGEVLTVLGKGQPAIIGGQKNFWYQVLRSNGQSGFVFGSLLTAYDPENPLSSLLTITETRLSKSDLTLNQALDLYQFLEKNEKTANALDQGLIAELRLKSLSRYAEILSQQAVANPNAKPDKPLESLVYYHELAGGFFVKPDVYWQTAKQYANSQSGDNLAFAAASAIYPGECEGETFCTLMRFASTGGLYLENYPRGQHVEGVLGILNEILPTKEELQETITFLTDSNAYSDLAALKNALRNLKRQVERSRSSQKVELLQKFQRLEAMLN